MPASRSRSTAKRHPSAPGLRSGPVREGCSVSGRVWVERGGETFLSWGRIVLLERIREHGSISAAARSMAMGYRHAWELVEEMNRVSPRALVKKGVGGKGGGGATLTPEGEAAVAGFWALVEDFGEWLSTRDARLWRTGAVGRTKTRRTKK